MKRQIPKEWTESHLNPAILDNLDIVFPEYDFVRRGNYWMAKKYLNGEDHSKRKDKTVCKIVKGQSGIFENGTGGDSKSFISLEMEKLNIGFLEACESLAKKVNIETPFKVEDYNQMEEYIPKMKAQENSTLVEFPSKIVENTLMSHSTLRESNTFYQYLLNHFDKKRVDHVFDLYKVGTILGTFNLEVTEGNFESFGPYAGTSVFWTIGTNGKAYAAEYIATDKDTGSSHKHGTDRTSRPIQEHFRILNGGYKYPDWLEPYKDADNRPFPFGTHLLNDKPLKKTVAIVESAKTAIIGHLLDDTSVWMATVGMGNISVDRFAPLKNHRIILYPDKGKAFIKWRKKARELRKSGFMVVLSDLVQNRKDLKEKEDLGDILNVKNIAVASAII